MTYTPPFAPTNALLRVSKAEKELHKNWREGQAITNRTGRSLAELRSRAAADRLGLANRFRIHGDRMSDATPAMYRDAVSRYYYSMYHAMRSVVFFVEMGDDYQVHSKLPQHVPADFPNESAWRNTLKTARLRRNEVDYDPYPKSQNGLKVTAEAMKLEASDLLRVSKQYLAAKGCAHV